MWRSFGLFMVLYMLVTIVTLVARPEVTRHFVDYPIAWSVVVLNLLAIGNIPRSIFKEQPFRAFLSSVLTMFSLVFLFGAALFPNLVMSSLGPAYHLTVYNASSSETTLRIMAIIAAIGGPLVLTYTGVIYWVFRGKVKLGEFSY
jgi:cytochrome d ubiquinol oxidase subunit II